jgi:hypothetical protein
MFHPIIVIGIGAILIALVFVAFTYIAHPYMSEEITIDLGDIEAALGRGN